MDSLDSLEWDVIFAPFRITFMILFHNPDFERLVKFFFSPPRQNEIRQFINRFITIKDPQAHGKARQEVCGPYPIILSISVTAPPKCPLHLHDIAKLIRTSLHALPPRVNTPA